MDLEAFPQVNLDVSAWPPPMFHPGEASIGASGQAWTCCACTPKVTPWGVMPGTSLCGTLEACGHFRVGGKMARSGQGAGEPPQAIVAEVSSPAPGASGLNTKMTWGLVGLGLVGHILRSPRFYETVVVAAIAVGSLRQIGQQNTASTTARLQAWDKRQMQRLERRAQRQARAAKGSAQMARSGPPRGLAGKSHETWQSLAWRRPGAGEAFTLGTLMAS
jgi:hypothetical protein